jgi:hypothetical protein
VPGERESDRDAHIRRGRYVSNRIFLPRFRAPWHDDRNAALAIPVNAYDAVVGLVMVSPGYGPMGRHL